MKAGQNMRDLDGWTEVSCEVADTTRGAQPVAVSSSLTDLDGDYGPSVIYTEWCARDTERPVLRDYLWRPHTESARCEHYVPEPDVDTPPAST